MCGIFACVGNGKKHRELVLKNFYLMKHRGPDMSSVLEVDERVIMGFHRLSMTGLDVQSNQPICIGKSILICNGEIYNYKEIAKHYNLTLTTNSDCEIISLLYNKYGINEVLQAIDAEFSFVLYDTKTQCVYIARDYLGIRPLFIGYTPDGTMMVASEAKCLYNCDKVRQFQPGYYMISDKLNIKYPYYNYNKFDTIWSTINTNLYLSHDFDTVCRNVNHLLTQSVIARSKSDRQVGAFLSGGLDSSVVVAIATKYNKNMPVFTIGLQDSPDIKAAKQVASFLKLTNHHVVTYTVQEGIDAIPSVIKSLESYDITTVRASTPQWLLSKYIRDNTQVKALLSGECIDEICGYYFLAFAEDDSDFNINTRRMLKDLHLYDLLRTDRTTAAHGLEVRLPFASRNLVRYIMNIKTSYKRFTKGELEKKIIRHAFDSYLPAEIINRKKHAFSDSVSNNRTSWYKEVAKYATRTVDSQRWRNRYTIFPFNTPISHESMWYREVFETLYPDMEKLIPNFWMPKIKGVICSDPSATVLDGFSE